MKNMTGINTEIVFKDIITVIGDGSLSDGQVLEALNFVVFE